PSRPVQPVGPRSSGDPGRTAVEALLHAREILPVGRIDWLLDANSPDRLLVGGAIADPGRPLHSRTALGRNPEACKIAVEYPLRRASTLTARERPASAQVGSHVGGHLVRLPGEEVDLLHGPGVIG